MSSVQGVADSGEVNKPWHTTLSNQILLNQTHYLESNSAFSCTGSTSYPPAEYIDFFTTRRNHDRFGSRSAQYYCVNSMKCSFFNTLIRYRGSSGPSKTVNILCNRFKRGFLFNRLLDFKNKTPLNRFRIKSCLKEVFLMCHTPLLNRDSHCSVTIGLVEKVNHGFSPEAGGRLVKLNKAHTNFK